MKVYEIRDGFGYEHLVCTERPDPEPRPGQIVVRVRACSLNFRDHLTITGKYNPRQPLPLIPLSDGAGEVIAVGEGVSRVAVGDRVAAAFAQDWIAGRPTKERLRSTLGGPRDGTLAEQICLPEHGVVRLPDYLTYEQAATLPCAALTAYNALLKYEPISTGQRVLLLGTGGVSIFALQFAKALGAEVILTSSSDEKLERAKALGADHVINYRSEPEWGKVARKLAGGVGVDCVVEVGGPGTLNQSLKAVRPGGHIALMGVLASGGEPPNLTSAFMNGIRVQGILVGCRDDFESMTRALEVSRLEPVVDRVFDFANAVEACRYLHQGKHFGKIVIAV